MALTGSASKDKELQGSVESGGTLLGKMAILKTLKGYSAYEVAVINGFSGTEEEWLATLKGKDGKDGKNGEDGYTPVKGKDYWTPEEQAEVAGAVKNANDAAANANQKASEAETAAGTAGEAAQAANDAAAAANLAAGSVDDAKTAANTAAQNANNAATELRQAAADGDFNGQDGKDGQDGYTPQKGVDYFDGEDGEDGYSPVRGTDYWTEADQQAIVSEILANFTDVSEVGM